jgi:hypothetical protein
MKKIYIIIFVTAFSGLGEAIGQWASNGTHIYNTNSGNVGIGSSTPGSLLYVSKFMTEPTVTIRNLGGFGGATYSMIDDASGADWKFKATLTGGFKIRDHANGLDVIVIEPNSIANALYINSAGNVGIGTSSPTSKLEVVGRNIELGDWVFLGRMYSGTDLLLGHNMKAIDDEDSRGAVVANTWSGGYSGIRMYQGESVNAGDPASNLRMRIDPEGNIGIGTSTPTTSALVDMSSTTQGFLPPRMTSAQMASIASPANGLMVYNTTDLHLYYYKSSVNSWESVVTEYDSWSCGEHMTITHNAGSVAPVSKLVTYGTVSNIPGEESKCWITSNLGADHQATAVNDTSESSAGWYWQFNRMQGYKHDGTTVTPAWTITDIDENSNWLLANDPCALLLSNGWRLPTYTEWNNVDANGGWSNWNGPWDSDLKMHAAGGISRYTSHLHNRGVNGEYWSNVQLENDQSWYLSFFIGDCILTNLNPKAVGNSCRCLRD